MPAGNIPSYKSYVPIFIMLRIATIMRLRRQYMSDYTLLLAISDRCTHYYLVAFVAFAAYAVTFFKEKRNYFRHYYFFISTARIIKHGLTDVGRILKYCLSLQEMCISGKKEKLIGITSKFELTLL